MCLVVIFDVLVVKFEEVTEFRTRVGEGFSEFFRGHLGLGGRSGRGHDGSGRDGDFSVGYWMSLKWKWLRLMVY